MLTEGVLRATDYATVLSLPLKGSGREVGEAALSVLTPSVLSGEAGGDDDDLGFLFHSHTTGIASQKAMPMTISPLSQRLQPNDSTTVNKPIRKNTALIKYLLIIPPTPPSSSPSATKLISQLYAHRALSPLALQISPLPSFVVGKCAQST